jgi:tetratricopeptide (TPR) repeat protein
MKAIAVYKQMLRVDNNMTDAHKALAEQYQALGMQKDSLRHYEIVASLFERGGRLQDALGVFRCMVEQQPDDLSIRVRLADYLAKQHMSNDAAREYQAAADIAQNAGLNEEYMGIAEKQLLVEPKNVELNRNLGRLYLQHGDPQKALVKIQQCFNLAPNDLETLPLVAEIFESLGQKNKATAVQKEMGRLYAEKGEVNHARTSWNKVLSVLPNDPNALRALEDLPASADSVVLKSSSPQKKPLPQKTAPSELLKEIDVFLTYGLKDKAIAHLKIALEKAPTDLSVHTRLVDVLKETDDKQAYLAAASQRLKIAQDLQDPNAKAWAQDIAPTDVFESPDTEVDIYLELEESQEAESPSEIHIQVDVDPIQISVAEVLAQFRAGVQQNVQQEDAETHFELGIAYREMGLLNEAKDSFNLAAQTPAKEIDAHHMLALIYMDEGDSEQALNLFEKILKKPVLNPSQKGANYFHKGLCHQRLNQKEDAYLSFRAAAATGEVLPGLKERLAVLAKQQ